MALSYINYTGNGEVDTFLIPFNYLEKEDISVLVDGESITSIEWVNPSTITISPTPLSGQEIRIKRTTQKDYPIVNFTNGAILDEASLDKNTEQLLYLVQEVLDIPSVIDLSLSDADELIATLVAKEIDKITALIGDITESTASIEETYNKALKLLDDVNAVLAQIEAEISDVLLTVATDEEVEEGTINNKAVSPKHLKQLDTSLTNKLKSIEGSLSTYVQENNLRVSNVEGSLSTYVQENNLRVSNVETSKLGNTGAQNLTGDLLVTNSIQTNGIMTCNTINLNGWTISIVE